MSAVEKSKGRLKGESMVENAISEDSWEGLFDKNDI